MAITPQHLAAVNSFDALAKLFYDELSWPQDKWNTLEAVADLYGIEKSTGVLSILAVQQLSADQTWGIFLVDFGENKLSRSQLRAILNKVAERERNNTHAERTWKHRNVLFVCRSEKTTWTLGHYTGDKPATAKLKTFGWSDPLSARTFLTRNLPYLMWADQANWAKAWDAEALTKEFYSEYDRVFKLVEQQTKHPGDAETKKLFVQSLFNRLMFLAFIEKMGWLSIDGNHDYLHALHQKHKQKPNKDTPTFFHVLQLLFFSGLNSINGIGGGNHLAGILGNVPYLNGGLFQLDPDTEPAGIAIPDNVFDEIFGDPNGLFRKYTFTVTESTPLDIDVAVDPEMLGKIFEELVTGRHESGSYYTPRPVVSFMCREALKGYLTENGIDPKKAENLVDEHLADDLKHGEISDILTLFGAIKIVDPACGSGAYLLGMLRELFDLIQIVERRRTEATPRELYSVKLDIIQNNLYGVDMDPFAVNIARLRMWLSLAVDHRGEHPEPLPNLDYKIEAGDSLVAPNPNGGQQPDLLRDADIVKLSALKKQFGKPALTLKDQEHKDSIQTEIEDLKLAISKSFGSPVKGFDWRVEFAEVFQERHDVATMAGNLNLGVLGQTEFTNQAKPGGFDIVLANPPYVRQEGIVQNMGKDYKANLVKNYPDTGSGTADLFIYFYDRGLQLVRPGGMFVYISSNKWFKANYGAKLRKHIAAKTTILSITDFGDLPVFKSAMAYAMIFVARKNSSDVPGTTEAATIFTQVPSLEEPYPDVKAVIAQSGSVLPSHAIQGEDWTLADAETLRKLSIMKSRGIPLGEYVKGQIYRGVLTGFNEAFVIDGATRERLIAEDPNSAEIIKPLAVGKDVRRWRIDKKDRWLIVTKIGVEMKRYPAIMAHLAQYETQLRKRTDQGNYWWELRACAYYDSFEKPKILYGQIMSAPLFAFQEEGHYCNQKCFLIGSGELFLLGLLNSTDVYNYLSDNSPILSGGFIEPRKEVVEAVPVPNASEADRAAIEVRVQTIIHLKECENTNKLVQVLKAGKSDCLDVKSFTALHKEKDIPNQIAALEAEIDERVSFLYFHVDEAPNYDAWLEQRKAEKGTAIEEVRNPLAIGHETSEFECKSSFCWDIKKSEIADWLKDEVHIAICAMLNAKGGDLLIGVDDDMNILGLAQDLERYGNKDKLVQAIEGPLGKTLTPNPIGLVDIKPIDIDGKTIVRVVVKPDNSERYKFKENIYVRRNSKSKPALTSDEASSWWSKRQRGEV